MDECKTNPTLQTGRGFFRTNCFAEIVRYSIHDNAHNIICKCLEKDGGGTGNGKNNQ